MNISRFNEVRPDGAVWQVYNLPSGGQVVITSKGRELFSRYPDDLKLMHEYRKAVTSHQAGTTAVRSYLRSGGNSDVYTAGKHLVVKEGTQDQSLLFALERMDTLYGVIEEALPRWLDMPAHYGLIYSRALDRQYMLMQRVDCGVTIEDVVAAPTETPEDLRATLGVIGPDERGEILDRYHEAHDLLVGAVKNRGMNPNSYITDYHEGNVLVERLRTPVAGSNYKLWIIDQ